MSSHEPASEIGSWLFCPSISNWMTLRGVGSIRRPVWRATHCPEEGQCYLAETSGELIFYCCNQLHRHTDTHTDKQTHTLSVHCLTVGYQPCDPPTHTHTHICTHIIHGVPFVLSIGIFVFSMLGKVPLYIVGFPSHGTFQLIRWLIVNESFQFKFWLDHTFFLGVSVISIRYME